VSELLTHVPDRCALLQEPTPRPEARRAASLFRSRSSCGTSERPPAVAARKRHFSRGVASYVNSAVTRTPRSLLRIVTSAGQAVLIAAAGLLIRSSLTGVEAASSVMYAQLSGAARAAADRPPEA